MRKINGMVAGEGNSSSGYQLGHKKNMAQAKVEVVVIFLKWGKSMHSKDTERWKRGQFRGS